MPSVSRNDTMDELVKMNSTERTINLYLVESAKDDSVPCYGFTWFPDDSIRNYIFLDKDFIRGNYLVTLMGHFFGLLSTHDTLGGFENVSENNCAESGDFLCDTWADPNLFLMVDTLCKYTGALLDRFGQDYVPSVANLMSESCDRCKCIFTPQQYRRMLFCVQRYRYYLKVSGFRCLMLSVFLGSWFYLLIKINPVPRIPRSGCSKAYQYVSAFKGFPCRSTPFQHSSCK